MSDLFEATDTPMIDQIEETVAEQRYTFDNRFYEITIPPSEPGEEMGTEFYPSVSTVLGTVQVGDTFGAWKEEQSSRLGVEGARLDLMLRAEYGTTVHRLCEAYSKGETVEWLDDSGKPRYTDFEWQRFIRFTQWIEAHEVEILATEMTVFSHEHRYAGTCDMLARVDGVTYLIDLKTSKYVGDHHLLQGAAYLRAVREMFPSLEIEGMAILALNTRTKAGYQWKTVEKEEEIERLDARFLGRLQLFHLEKPDFQPKRDLLPTIVEPTHTIGEIDDSSE